MRPATWPREQPLAERLLRVDPAAAGAARLTDLRISDLPSQLRAGDLVVVNDAATLPASLRGRAGEREIEARLLRQHGDGPVFTAVLFGEGDWRTPTERRPAPPPLPVGARVAFGPAGEPPLAATITWVSPDSPRLCDLRFDREGAALWAALYRAGRPVQYAYLRGPLSLWHVQTPYAGRPLAAECPSAGRPLRWEVLLGLRRAGARLAALTHGAGLSSTGDPLLDRALPLRERYDLPAETVAAIAKTRAAGGRVLAVGTTVVRALEGCAAQHGRLVPGPGETELRLDRRFRRRVTDGILTGMHESGASHLDLLRAFVEPALLAAAYAHAEAAGYLCHEFGDSCLILPS